MTIWNKIHYTEYYPEHNYTTPKNLDFKVIRWHDTDQEALQYFCNWFQGTIPQSISLKIEHNSIVATDNYTNNAILIMSNFKFTNTKGL
jgi:hypothetical protein